MTNYKIQEVEQHSDLTFLILNYVYIVTGFEPAIE